MSVLTTVSTTRMNITIIVGKDTNEHLHSYTVHSNQRTIMDITILFGGLMWVRLSANGECAFMSLALYLYDKNEHLHSYPVYPDSWTQMNITIIVEEQRGKKPAFNRLFSICSHFLLCFFTLSPSGTMSDDQSRRVCE